MYVDRLIRRYKTGYNPNVKMYTRYTNNDWKEIANYLISNHEIVMCEKIVTKMTRDSKLAIEMSKLLEKL